MHRVGLVGRRVGRWYEHGVVGVAVRVRRRRRHYGPAEIAQLDAYFASERARIMAEADNESDGNAAFANWILAEVEALLRELEM